MKRSGVFVCLLLSLLLSACWEKKEKPAVEKPYEPRVDLTVTEPRDTVIVGRLGEETAMSSLQVITDEGDTLGIAKTSSLGVEGIMLGEVRNYDDRVMVAVRVDKDGEMSLISFVNITQLEGVWKNDETQMQLQRDSVAQCLGMNYTHWRVEKCKLLLMGENATEYGQSHRVDTALIRRLDSDSLYLDIPRHGELRFGR